MTNFDVFRNEKDVRNYSAGDIIFEQGSEGDVMYGVLEGQIELLYNGKKFDTLSKGDMFGEMVLLDQITRTATAKAKTAAKVAVINRTRFLWLVQETPMFALQVMRIMADRIRKRTKDAFGAEFNN